MSVIFCNFLNAQQNISIDAPNVSYSGLSLLQCTNGTGIGGYWEKTLNVSNRIGAKAALIFLKGEDEYPIYNYYTGMYYESPNKKRLSFLPLYLSYKKMLFTDQIANNFRPFLSLQGGPLIALDPPNIQKFSDRIKRITTEYTFSTRAGAGIEFLYGRGTIISLFVGYDMIRFKDYIDETKEVIDFTLMEVYEDKGKKVYSGLVVSISFGRQKSRYKK